MPIIISDVINIEQKIISGSFSSRSLRPEIFGDIHLNPFISADHFRMSQPTFPEHPHAGFSAVTYMLERSVGGFINRDSLGDRSLINPGDLHWTLAGRGIRHEEVPARPGDDCEGIQLFVNLSAKNKFIPAKAFHSEKNNFLRIMEKNISIKILTGKEGGIQSPLQLPERFDYLDVEMNGSAQYQMLNKAGFASVFYVYEGFLNLQLARHKEIPLSVHQAFALSSEQDTVLNLESGQGKMLIFRAPQLNEPVVFGGPFIMNSAEQISDAWARYRAGRF